MNLQWILLVLLGFSALFFVIGNELLFILDKDGRIGSLEARLCWTLQLLGLTLGVISLLEIYVRTKEM